MNELNSHKYYENIVIWNRSHIGERVWGPLYRNTDKDIIANYLQFFETKFLQSDINTTYLIYLYADPEFLVKLEDGNSFSTTSQQKQNELNLFSEAIESSIIKNKLSLKVCDENQQFYSKEHVLTQVLNFIK
jgi:hypothetical protein